MTTPHRATPEQWAAIEAAASPREIGHGVTMHHAITVVAAGLVDIRARIEALEQLHQAVVDLNEQFSLEPLVARIEALEAAQQLATTEESSAVQGDDHQSLHTVALGMVDTLERLGVLPEILDTLRRAIWAPMEQPAPGAAQPAAPPQPGGRVRDGVSWCEREGREQFIQPAGPAEYQATQAAFAVGLRDRLAWAIAANAAPDAGASACLIELAEWLANELRQEWKR